MIYVAHNGKIQLDRSYLEERRFYHWGAKWFLIEDKHMYVLIRNKVLARAVLEEIGDNGKIIQEGTMELQDDGSWIVPPAIFAYFNAGEMVIYEDSKGFFMTSPSEAAQYEREIRNLADQILFLLEESD